MEKTKIFPLIICASFLLGACGPTDSTSSTDTSSSSDDGDYRNLVVFDLPRQIVGTYYDAYENREDPDLINTGHEFSQDRFFITENGQYKVGDDNPFVFLPKILARTGVGLNTVVLTSYRSIAKVDIKESSNWRELPSSEIETYVSVDTLNSTFDFTEAAIGHEFKLCVIPDGEYYNLATSIAELSFEVVIVDGFNVHNTAELSMLDNSSSLWDEYKNAHGLNTAELSKGIILHDDLTLTINDLPAGFFYTENDVNALPGIDNYVGPDGGRKASVIGSLKDFVSIYTHDTPEDETFIFEGNFFSIDGTGIPIIRKFNNVQIDSTEQKDSHSNLFGFPGDATGTMHTETEVTIPAQPSTPQGDVVMRNLKVVGNGGRDSTGAGNGGFIFTKAGAKQMTWENVIAIDVFTAFLSRYRIGEDEALIEQGPISSLIDYCKAFDSYSNMVYYYGSENNFITNSVFKRAGGSLIICDEVFSVSNFNEDSRRVSNLTTTNFEYDSFVVGDESWFVSHNAVNAVSALKPLGALFTGYATANVNTENKNIIKDDKMNIIALLIRGDDVFTNTATELKSVISINETSAPLDAMNLMTNTTFGPIINYAQTTDSQMATFESSEGGRACVNVAGTGYDFALATPAYALKNFSEILGGVPSPEEWNNISTFFQGETINLYLKPPLVGSRNIGIILGYN